MDEENKALREEIESLEDEVIQLKRRIDALEHHALEERRQQQVKKPTQQELMEMYRTALTSSDYNPFRGTRR